MKHLALIAAAGSLAAFAAPAQAAELPAALSPISVSLHDSAMPFVPVAAYGRGDWGRLGRSLATAAAGVGGIATANWDEWSPFPGPRPLLAGS